MIYDMSVLFFKHVAELSALFIDGMRLVYGFMVSRARFKRLALP